MVTDRLYELAFQYKKTKLWEKISDLQIFAVKLPNGRTGYLSIMRDNGFCHGVCLYIGDEGYWTFRNLWKEGGRMLYDLEYENEAMGLKCLQCAFEKKDMLSANEYEEIRTYTRPHGIRLTGKYAYPRFWKREPYCLPWKLQTEEEADCLCQGLSAAIEMANFLEGTTRDEFYLEEINGATVEIPMLEQKDGAYVLAMTRLPENEPPRWPEPKQYNEIAMASLKKARREGTWQCQIMRLMEPVQDDPEEIPAFPAQLLVVDVKSGHILPLAPVVCYEREPEKLFNKMLEAFAQQGVCPEKVEVSDEMTFAFFRALSEKLGVSVAMRDRLPELEAAREDLLDKLDMDSDEVMDEFNALLNLLTDMGGGKLPKEIDRLLRQLENEGFLQSGDLDQLERKQPKVKGKGPGRKKTANESYVISVSLGRGCYRHIRISGKCTLWDLHSAILDAFAFDDDHAHAFFMDNVKWSDQDSYYTEAIEEEGPTTEKTRIGSVGLCKGMAFKYMFDFGDEWVFQCKVLKVEPGDLGEAVVIKSKGEAPSQYGDLDDEWDDE